MDISSSITKESFDYVRGLLNRLAQPIALARRQGGTKEAAIKNLNRFISDQILQALGEVVLPRKIEADLLLLRSLFEGEKNPAPQDDITRLNHAQQILDRISFCIESLCKKNTPFTKSLTGKKPDPTPPRYYAKPQRGQRQTKRVDQPLHEMSIRYAKGVGPKRALLLEKLGIRTIEDALWVLPWRYEDRSTISSMFALVAGEKATVAGVVERTTLRRIPRRNMTLVSVFIHDGTGTVEAVFFNQPYLEKTFQAGMRVILSGLVNADPRRRTHWQMRTPQFEIADPEENTLIHVGRIVPVYHETKGLTSRHLRWMLHTLLGEYQEHLQDILPRGIRDLHKWPAIGDAMHSVHFPNQEIDLHDLNAWKSPSHRRLAFEECFILQVALAIRQSTNQTQIPGIAFKPHTPLINQLLAQLSFQLTDAQLRVITEIHQDMVRPSPMNRLIQGDVGSGKTIVALHAILLACGSGYQAALMVPTEILAEQHFLNLQKYLDKLEINMALISGGRSLKERSQIHQRIAEGEIQLVIGTHALLEETVQFSKLGLVVVDEQHKFGVLQRATLRTKGIYPDVMVMTATPIPRTLAMTAYGDLDVSVIDQMPPGRKPINTKVFPHNNRSRAYSLIRKQIENGRQAYIVYPLVEESENVDLEAATQAARRLQDEEFPSFSVGLLHGRMKSKEKTKVMTAFKDGHLQILVATTVVEVGLDVPNATVMAIEHADRFGLAQLHQMRGRVGRGKDQSFCLLISSMRGGRKIPEANFWNEPFRAKDMKYVDELPLGLKETWASQQKSTFTQSAKQRLKAMVNCSDGFAIAEQDLRIRGPGEFLGTRQSGVPEFRVADLVRDSDLLEQARNEAFQLIRQDPELARPEHQALKTVMLQRWKTKLDLGSIG